MPYAVGDRLKLWSGKGFSCWFFKSEHNGIEGFGGGGDDRFPPRAAVGRQDEAEPGGGVELSRISCGLAGMGGAENRFLMVVSWAGGPTQ